MRVGVKEGITYAKESLVKAKAQLEKITNVTDVTHSEFYIPFKKVHKKTKTQKEAFDIQERAQKVISNKVIPAFKKLQDYIFWEYEVRKTPGLLNPGLYQSCIEYHTSLRGVNASSIHQIGLRQVCKMWTLLQSIIFQNDFFLIFMSEKGQGSKKTSRGVWVKVVGEGRQHDFYTNCHLP